MKFQLHPRGVSRLHLGILALLLLICLTLIFYSPSVFAVGDPKSYPNNKFGVHILFTPELEDAAKLVNSSGGDWGYVTIPIQAGDKDLVKWQNFMDSAKQNHIIPILRLSTEGDYFTNSNWRKPNFTDILDFANFLDSLNWPIINRYVVIFNEPNRNDEWGGDANASEYAQILAYASEAFKAKNNNFFIISAGLDNASDNNQYTFMQEMYNAVPNVFSQIDAIGSHAYPNPGFEQPPWVISRKSISSFSYEKRLADILAGKDLPVFITETGWSSNSITKLLIGRYFKEAFTDVWSDKSIVAVTPFLFNAGAGPFAQFSLINTNGDKNEIYNSIKDFPKIKGTPKFPLSDNNDTKNSTKEILPIKDFSDFKEFDNSGVINSVDAAVELVRWILRV